jgi:hypothetical protein
VQIVSFPYIILVPGFVRTWRCTVLAALSGDDGNLSRYLCFLLHSAVELHSVATARSVLPVAMLPKKQRATDVHAASEQGLQCLHLVSRLRLCIAAVAGH